VDAQNEIRMSQIGCWSFALAVGDLSRCDCTFHTRTMASRNFAREPSQSIPALCAAQSQEHEVAVRLLPPDEEQGSSAIEPLLSFLRAVRLKW
jgi:hypothetical protein